MKKLLMLLVATTVGGQLVAMHAEKKIHDTHFIVYVSSSWVNLKDHLDKISVKISVYGKDIGDHDIYEGTISKPEEYPYEGNRLEISLHDQLKKMKLDIDSVETLTIDYIVGNIKFSIHPLSIDTLPRRFYLPVDIS